MVSIAFVKGLDKKIVSQISACTTHTLDIWSEARMTEAGSEVDSSSVNLIAVEETPQGYSATLRIGLEVLKMEKKSDGTNYGAYGRLTVTSGDELYESLRLFYEASRNMPLDEKGRVVLEKGGTGRLAALNISSGVFRVELEDEPVQSSADVDNSSYYRIVGYEVYGQVSFQVPTGSLAKTSVLKGMFANDVERQEQQPKSMLKRTPNKVSLNSL